MDILWSPSGSDKETCNAKMTAHICDRVAEFAKNSGLVHITISGVCGKRGWTVAEMRAAQKLATDGSDNVVISFR